MNINNRIGKVERLRLWSGIFTTLPVEHEKTIFFLWTSVSLLCSRICLDHHWDFETLWWLLIKPCFWDDYQSFFQSNFRYHFYLLSSPCLRCYNILASVIRGMLNSALLIFFFSGGFLIVKNKRIRYNLIAYLDRRQCNHLKGLLLVYLKVISPALQV